MNALSKMPSMPLLVRFACAVSLTAVVVAHPGEALGQQVLLGVANGGDEAKAYRAQLRFELKQFKDQLNGQLAARIDDMHRVCVLSDEQQKTLQVAAKGTIDKLVRKFRTQSTQLLQQWGVALGEDNDDGLVEDEEADDGATARAMFGDRSFLLQQIVSTSGDQLKPENQKIWVKAVEKTLSEDQVKKYDEAVAARQEVNRKAAVEAFVARADTLLLMDGKQRSQLAEEIDRQFGEVLRLELEREPDLDGNIFIMDSSSGRISRQIKEILTPVQLQIWQAKFADQLESMRLRQGQMQQQKGGLLNWLFGN